MPDVMDEFPHLKDWETFKLHARYSELRGDPTAAEPKTDLHLRELVCLARILRGRASTTNESKPKADKKTIPSLDAL